jgi:hypothetical protein
MPGIGKGSAVGVISSLLVSYPRVKLALVIRIYRGTPPLLKYKEIFLGNVIISNLVIKYNFG